MTMTGGEGRGPGATNGQCAIPDTVAATHASRDCTALNTHASRDLPRKSSVLQAQATGKIFLGKKRELLCCAQCSVYATPAAAIERCNLRKARPLISWNLHLPPAAPLCLSFSHYREIHEIDF